MQDLFDWKIALRDVREHGRKGTHEANASERIELARVLDVISCEALRVTYEVHPLRAGMYRLSGHIVADVVQACVVTLEPVPDHIDEPINIELRSADMMPAAPEGEQGILDAADIQPIEDDAIDLGLLVLEHISTALNPYPRKEGAGYEYSDPGEADPDKPFSALAKLKDRT